MAKKAKSEKTNMAFDGEAMVAFKQLLRIISYPRHFDAWTCKYDMSCWTTIF